MEPNSAIKHFRRSPFAALARRPACRTLTDRGLSSFMANRDPGRALVHHHAALPGQVARIVCTTRAERCFGFIRHGAVVSSGMALRYEDMKPARDNVGRGYRLLR